MKYEEKEYLIDDRPIKIPPDVEAMSEEEIEREVERILGRRLVDGE